jgi:SNF2 family DNA or RNA helicase
MIPHFKTVSYLKLDGDVPNAQRPTIVARFNEDPTIKILFLTTQVGSLGLNLASANKVIMFDHDYNPVKFKDLFYKIKKD